MMTVMRYPEGHKDAVRERIIGAASEAVRRRGIDGVSIPALMKQAGLTHGGFYAHFESRDALVAEAVRAAAEDTARGPFAEGVALEQTLARYLSPGHLMHPEQGCVLAALGTEAPKQPKPVRRAFAEVARGFIGRVERKLGPRRGARAASDAALVQASTMIGAVILARLVDDTALGERILGAARRASSN
jgi:TetR/AcrR family transcriptional repressor of nem operon